VEGVRGEAVSKKRKQKEEGGDVLEGQGMIGGNKKKLKVIKGETRNRQKGLMQKRGKAGQRR